MSRGLTAESHEERPREKDAVVHVKDCVVFPVKPAHRYSDHIRHATERSEEPPTPPPQKKKFVRGREREKRNRDREREKGQNVTKVNENKSKEMKQVNIMYNNRTGKSITPPFCVCSCINVTTINSIIHQSNWNKFVLILILIIISF